MTKNMTTNHVAHKQPEHDEIARLTEEFERRGGQVQKLAPDDVSGRVMTPWKSNPLAREQEYGK